MYRYARVSHGGGADSWAMSTLSDVIRQNTDLDRDEAAHLIRLVSEWGMIADLSFSDLLLHLCDTDGNWLIAAQVRAATGQTVFDSDLVGVPTGADVAALLESARAGHVIEGTMAVDAEEPFEVLAIPVPHDGRVVGVLTRVRESRPNRRPGELERVYTDVFGHFTLMIAGGKFPFPSRVGDSSSAPRIGDGVVTIDAEGMVRYVSPNANSALHRVGIMSNPVGTTLQELGFNDEPVRHATERRLPVIEEFEQGRDITLLCRCVPLLDPVDDGVRGVLMMMRDVTELRRRDRLLLSKDATIREIHHRVKNNLQTISSLLRLQARRLTHPEAISAVGESVRRIRTIALVHEALSREPGEDVTLLEIVRPLLRLAEEGLQSPDRPVRFTVEGDGGRVPATIATPLSVVLTELLQNAVEHGFGDGVGGDVVVQLAHESDRLSITVVDDGRGVDPGFDLEAAEGLGLSIVRTLVTTELAGTISITAATPDDLEAAGLDGSGRGTIIAMDVPTFGE